MPDELEPIPPPPPEDADAAYLEQRARQLGLPTDPEAYQDGGLAVAATAMTVTDADLLVALLRGQGVPAWVDAPLSVLNAAAAGPVSVLVPMGRLADAQEMLSERVSLDVPAETSAPEDGIRPWRRGTVVRMGVSAFFLVTGICNIFILAAETPATYRHYGPKDQVWLGLGLWALMAAGFIVAGLWGLIAAWRRRNVPNDSTPPAP